VASTLTLALRARARRQAHGRKRPKPLTGLPTIPLEVPSAVPPTAFGRAAPMPGRRPRPSAPDGRTGPRPPERRRLKRDAPRAGKPPAAGEDERGRAVFPAGIGPSLSSPGERACGRPCMASELRMRPSPQGQRRPRGALPAALPAAPPAGRAARRESRRAGEPPAAAGRRSGAPRRRGGRRRGTAARRFSRAASASRRPPLRGRPPCGRAGCTAARVRRAGA